MREIPALLYFMNLLQLIEMFMNLSQLSFCPTAFKSFGGLRVGQLQPVRHFKLNSACCTHTFGILRYFGKQEEMFD